MTTNESPSTVMCPLARATVDAERCAACAYRSAAYATCTSIDRITVNDWHFLLRSL